MWEIVSVFNMSTKSCDAAISQKQHENGHSSIDVDYKAFAHQRLDKLSPESAFFCPITSDMMIDPVITADGHTYERSAITAWLQMKNTSPVTNSALPHTNLVPNFALKSAIENYKSSHVSFAQKCMQELVDAFEPHFSNSCRRRRLPVGPEPQLGWEIWIPAVIPPLPLLLCGLFFSLSVARWPALLQIIFVNIWRLFRLAWFAVCCVAWLGMAPFWLIAAAVGVVLIWLSVIQRRVSLTF